MPQSGPSVLASTVRLARTLGLTKTTPFAYSASMTTPNPYAPPEAEVADVRQVSGTDKLRLNRIASGQRFIIFALLGSFAAGALQAVFGPLAGILGLLASLVAIVGVVRLAGALGRSVLAKVLYAFAMLIPLINLLGMLALSSQATKALRAGGYTVGLFGAKAQ